MEKDSRCILLRDLCGRLPYSVKAKYYGAEEECECIDVIEGIYPFDNEIAIGQYGLKVEAIKPYLFPLSSVTLELRCKIQNSLPDNCEISFKNQKITFYNEGNIQLEQLEKIFNLFNLFHIDYRGLIPKGLAIDATGLNIYKNKE